MTTQIRNSQIQYDFSSFRNAIINGDMRIAQRGTSFSGLTGSGYTLDRWGYGESGSSVVAITQNSDSPSVGGLRNCLRLEVTTADASVAASDYLILQQRVEGYNICRLLGRTCTLSFWVKSNITGTYCVSLRNSGTNRSYVVEYDIVAADTWEFKSLQIPMTETGGTWNYTNGVGLYIYFALMCGSDWYTTANAWNAGSYLVTANQANLAASTGNDFRLTGVQLEVGSGATDFEFLNFSAQLDCCKRYYEHSYEYGTYPGTVTDAGKIVDRMSGAEGTFYELDEAFSVEKRATPAITIYSPNSGTANRFAINGVDNTPSSQYMPSTRSTGSPAGSSAGTSNARIDMHYVADAEL